MNLATVCLGILLSGQKTGYQIQTTINTSMAHFHHASLGAIYPALGNLEARDFVTASLRPRKGLSKRLYQITPAGRNYFESQMHSTSAAEWFRSEFLTAFYFAGHLNNDDVSRLIDDRLSAHRRERQSLLALPISSLSEGQRFTVRYVLALKSAAIDFLKGEGRAIETAILRQQID